LLFVKYCLFFYERFKSKVKIPVNYIDFNVTFNYTPTIQKIYNIENEVIYLHGKIDADNLKQNIILGVSDIPKGINDKKAFDFLKKYQKF